MFYKFISDTKIEKAPKPLKVGGNDVFTNSKKIHNENGYYKLSRAEYPQDDKNYEPRYTLNNKTIVESWVEVTIDEVT